MEFDSSIIRLPSFFNASRNIDKAVSGLIGILNGVIADKKIAPVEILYLNLWLKNQNSLKDDPDAFDLIDLIGDIVEDGVVTSEEMNDLVTLCNDIANIRSKESTGEYEAKLNEFLGLLQGIIADGVVNTREFHFINEWINSHRLISEDWIVSKVSGRIKEILEDNLVTKEELEEFGNVIKQLTGYQFNETGDAECASISYLADSVEKLTPRSTICFTGTFITGTRKSVEGIATKVDLIPQKNVTKKLNYLVIGEIISPDWRFQSYGRKIEAAVKLRESGSGIVILTEKSWTSLIKEAL